MPMGSGMPSWGRFTPGIRDRLAAMKSQYLKKPSSARLKIHRLGHEPPGLFVVGPVLLHQQSVGVVDGDGHEHDDDVHRFAPAVEQQAHQQQNEVRHFRGTGSTPAASAAGEK